MESQYDKQDGYYYELHKQNIISDCYSFEYSETHEPKENICCARHIHQDLELIYIIGGAMTAEVNQTQFEARSGDLLIFNPLDFHSGWVSSELPSVSYTYAVVNIDSFRLASDASEKAGSVIDDLVNSRSRFVNRIPKCALTDRIGSAIIELSELCGVMREKSGTEYAIGGNVLLILGLLVGAGYITGSSPDTQKSNSFIRQVIGFLEKNYMKEITPEMLRAEFPYDRSYFCRLFRRHMKDSFSNYLCRFRISKAKSEFMNGSDHLLISEIAEKVGFTDYCWFTHAFKRYIGVTPTEYLKKSGADVATVLQ